MNPALISFFLLVSPPHFPTDSPDVRLLPTGVIRHMLSCDITLVCTSSSPYAPTFTWALEGGSLPSTAVSSCEQGCSRLTVTRPTDSDLGNYSCTVNDSVHATQTRSVLVRESDELYFRSANCNATTVDASFVLGEQVELECVVGGAASAVANVSFVWFRGDEKLDSSLDRVSVTTEGERASMLVIEAATVDEDEAVYLCRVEDSSGTTIDLNFDVYITGMCVGQWEEGIQWLPP